MLASPNSASKPKYVLFTTLTCGVSAMTPTLRQHVKVWKWGFHGKFHPNPAPLQQHSISVRQMEVSRTARNLRTGTAATLALEIPSLLPWQQFKRQRAATSQPFNQAHPRNLRQPHEHVIERWIAKRIAEEKWCELVRCELSTMEVL